MISLINQQGELNRDLIFPAATANIAIFGTQGSGKSTLLNQTFATAFPVLDTTVGRGRCTKGVWLHSAESVNLIDTEGFDSVDRNQDERLFEKQMALLCVAVADVVLVNLWLGEVGRHSGSHMDVLESILKVGERLVQPQTKKILFVVRDCGVDENRPLVEQTLTRSVNQLITANNNKNLKLTVSCFFLSHYIYEPERFKAEAVKLKATVAVRKVSEFNCYRQRDKYTYLKELWRRIKTDSQVDLKSINDAIRSHIVHRLREEMLDLLAKELGLYNGLTDTRSYEAFLYQLRRTAVDYSLDNRHSFTSQSQAEALGKSVFDLFEPQAIRHFGIVLKRTEDELESRLVNQIERGGSSKRLSHLILRKRREIVDIYKKFTTGHKEYSLLLRGFNERLGELIAKQERKLNHLFNLFESAAELQLNAALSDQVRRLIFRPEEIQKCIKAVCQEWDYNEWEVEFREIWERVSYRCMEKLLPAEIETRSIRTSVEIWALSGDQTTNLIARHTALQKRALDFCSDVLRFLHEENSFMQPLSQVKDRVRECLSQRIKEEARRFKPNILLVAMVLLLLHGEVETLLGWTSLRKKQRRYWLRVYILGSCVSLLLASLRYWRTRT